MVKQGDIIWLDFNPQTGHEQSGRRPALVVSNESFNRFSKMAIVCPITNTDLSLVKIVTLKRFPPFPLLFPKKFVPLQADYYPNM